MTWDAQAAASALRDVGLDPAKFDLAEIATDLEARTEMSRSLIEPLDTGAAAQPPIGFDPRWAP